MSSDTLPAKRRVSRKYDDQTKDKALALLFICGGSANKASKQLAAAGINIPDDTLRYWQRVDADRYHRLSVELAPQMAESLANSADELSQRISDLERQAVDRLETELTSVPARDLAKTLVSLSTSKALQQDRISGPIRGRPKVIEIHHDAEALLNRIASRLGHQVDGSAEEIQDAEQVPASNAVSA